MFKQRMVQSAIWLPRALHEKLKEDGGERGLGAEIRRRLEWTYKPWWKRMFIATRRQITDTAHPVRRKIGNQALDAALNELERVMREWRDSELTSRDFQMMLGRLCHRFEKKLNIEDTVRDAKDLILRKGTLSSLREAGHP